MAVSKNPDANWDTVPFFLEKWDSVPLLKGCETEQTNQALNELPILIVHTVMLPTTQSLDIRDIPTSLLVQ